MKYACIVVLLFLFTSCEYLNVKKTSSEEILQEKLEAFNWNELDVYPTFSACDSALEKLEKKQCFERVLTDYLTDYLANQHFVVSRDVSDTLQLKFIISHKGDATITDIKIKEETLYQLPNLRAVLLKSTDSLPQIFPAIKQSQPVRSQFTLPVVIAVN